MLADDVFVYSVDGHGKNLTITIGFGRDLFTIRGVVTETGYILE